MIIETVAVWPGSGSSFWIHRLHTCWNGLCGRQHVQRPGANDRAHQRQPADGEAAASRVSVVHAAGVRAWSALCSTSGLTDLTPKGLNGIPTPALPLAPASPKTSAG